MAEQFSISPKGYNKEEVKQFVDHVTKEYGSMLDRLKKTDALNANLQEQVDSFALIEKRLKDTITLAENANLSSKKKAEEEAEQIIENARNDASIIVNDALLRAKEIEEKSQTMKKQFESYKQQIKLLMEEQNELLDKSNLE